MNPDTNGAMPADDQPPAIPVPGSVIHPTAPSETVAPAADPTPPPLVMSTMPEAPAPEVVPPMPEPVMPPPPADPIPAPAPAPEPVMPPPAPAPLPTPPPAMEPAPMPPLPAGAPISTSAPAPSVPSMSVNSGGGGNRFNFNPRGMVKWVGIAVGVIVILVVGFIVITTISVNAATAGAVTAGDSFIKAAQGNDAAAAYALTSENFKAVVPANQMGALLTTLDQSISGKSSVVSRSVSSKSGETTKAAIVYRFDGGVKAYFRINAEKVDGKWQIINYRASETTLDAELE